MYGNSRENGYKLWLHWFMGSFGWTSSTQPIPEILTPKVFTHSSYSFCLLTKPKVENRIDTFESNNNAVPTPLKPTFPISFKSYRLISIRNSWVPYSQNNEPKTAKKFLYEQSGSFSYILLLEPLTFVLHGRVCSEGKTSRFSLFQLRLLFFPTLNPLLGI